jgi:hypothetical protein
MRRKKADVVERPETFDHVGSLVNKPPGWAGLPFTKLSDQLEFSSWRSFGELPPPINIWGRAWEHKGTFSSLLGFATVLYRPLVFLWE